MESGMLVDHRNMGAAIRRLSLPIAFTMLGDQLLGVVDTIAIGSLGAVALAGVTGAATVFTAVAFSIFGFFSGMSIIAAQRVGARDLDGYGSTVRAGFIVPFVGAIVAALASIPLAPVVIHAMVGHLASAHQSSLYLTLRCFSLLPIAISGTLIVGLGAAGNRVLGVLVLAVVNIVHIPLLLILALGWGTHHPLGIEGAGISSLLSESIACVCAVIYTLRRPIYRVFASFDLNLRLALERARILSFWLTTLTGPVCALLAWPLAFIFTLNAVVATVAAWPLALHMLTLPLKGYAMVSMSPIRASGDTRFSLTVGILTGVLVVPVCYLCIKVLHIGLYGVPVAWIVAWSARAVATAIKVRGESWTRRELIAAG